MMESPAEIPASNLRPGRTMADVLDARKPLCKWAVLIVTLAAAVWAHLVTRGVGFRLDELGHFYQVEWFVSGRWELFRLDDAEWPALAMLPGYHVVMAAIAKVTGAASLDALRLYQIGFGLLLASAAWAIVRSVAPEYAFIRAAQLFCFPLLFTFEFLVYTEPLSLLCMALCLLAAMHQRFLLAGIAAFAALLVRQNSVVFIGFVVLFAYVQQHGWTLNMRTFGQHLLRCWLMLLAITGFLVFVYMNGAVGLDGPHTHPLTISVGNPIFALALLLVLMLPLHVMNISEVDALIRLRWPWMVALVAMAAAVVFSYAPAHPFNSVDFLNELARNHVLEWFFAPSPSLPEAVARKAMLTVVVVLSLLFLSKMKLLSRGAYLIYPISLVILMPAGLVEPRYYLPILMVLVLFQERRPPQTETLLWAYYLALAAAVHYFQLHSGYML